jgi:hypothetical protein
MQLQATVGAPSATQQPGQQPNLRAGGLSDLIVSEFLGRYGEATYRRQSFSGATQAGVATSAAFATGYVGLCLSNPLGSSVNLHLNKVGYSSIVAQTVAMAIGLMVGYSASANVTHTSPLTPRSNFVGVGAPGVGMLDSAATLPAAPTLQAVLGTLDTGALTVAVGSGLTLGDLESSIILPPGGFACIYTTSAAAAGSILASFGWQEQPL